MNNPRVEIISPAKWLFYLKYMLEHPGKTLGRVRFKMHQLRDPFYPCWAPSAVEYVKKALPPSALVAEFGSGRSSIWLAKKFEKVIAIEHNPDWADYVASLKEKEKCRNLEIVLSTFESSEDYVGALNSSLGGRQVDLLIIDGLFRKECAEIVPQTLKEGGIILVDDTYRAEYSSFLTPSLGKFLGRFVNCGRTTDLYRKI